MWPKIAAGVALLAIGAAGAWWWGARPGTASTQLKVRQLTADAGLTTTPAISADGKLVAYATDRATQKDLDIWVQPLGEGAQPIRVTRHESDDLEPSFSPDGGLIVFRSKREGGGIYIVPALGGEERLLVRGGRRPRFSPDGRWVAYTQGLNTLSESTIWIVPASGGTPRRLAEDVAWTANPVFSPDGQYVLFVGAPGTFLSAGQYKVYVTPVAGGTSTRTEILSALSKEGVSSLDLIYGTVEWLDDQLLFSSRGHLSEVGITRSGWKTTGPARQITSGASQESDPRAVVLAGRVRITFSVGSSAWHLWSLRLEPNKGRVLGEIEPLSHEGGRQSQPASSADGRRLVYTQRQPGGSSLRIRDLATGKESTLVSQSLRGRPSPDGSLVAYAPSGGVPGVERAIYLMPAAGGEPTRLTAIEGQGTIYGWSLDGKKVVFYQGSPIRFMTVDVETGKVAHLVSHPKISIHGAELSPDQKWVAFHTPSGRSGPIYITPVRNGEGAAQPEWIKIVDRGVENQRPWWSPDGNLLYFISRLDGFWCIFAQRLDAGKNPAGEPFPVYHFHGARLHPSSGLAPFGPAILPDRIIFSLEEETGNVWLGDGE